MDVIDDYVDTSPAFYAPYQNIPDDLKSLPNWVCYKLEQREHGKIAKIPIDPGTGRGADASDPNTWGTYEQALDSLESYVLDGIGFELGESFNGLIFIDLDHVIENGRLKPFAENIVKRLNSYTEVSPSKTGLHILCKSKNDMQTLFGEGARHRNDSIGLEMYDRKRYFTVTGNPYGKPIPMRFCEDEIKAVYEEHLKPKPQTQLTPSGMSSLNLEESQIATQMIVPSPDDGVLLQKMFNSANGEKIKKLFEGDSSLYEGIKKTYQSQSEADMALVNHLTYWTNGDEKRIDRIFRTSGLMRSKWDEGTPSYGQRTIRKALDSISSQPGPNNMAIKDDSRLQQVPDWYAESNLAYLGSPFDDDLKKFKVLGQLKTGFSNIDAITSLYPGLYLLGGLTGLGKTTFSIQLANQLAQNGNHVFYFSLEQSRFELVLKGLSRLTVREVPQGKYTGVSAMKLRELSPEDEILQSAIEQYREFAGNERFIECRLGSIGVIQGNVESHIQKTGVAPIVIVDYLQNIQATETNKTTKDVVDSHMRLFKKLQADNSLVVILLSSLNRQAYTNPLEFESFKESGGIEFSADVIWGLQFQVMHMDSFEKANASAKRTMLREANADDPRHLELVCLKNRFGKAFFSCWFDYYPQFDLFVPANRPYWESYTPQSRPSI